MGAAVYSHMRMKLIEKSIDAVRRAVTTGTAERGTQRLDVREQSELSQEHYERNDPPVPNPLPLSCHLYGAPWLCSRPAYAQPANIPVHQHRSRHPKRRTDEHGVHDLVLPEPFG